MFLQSKVNNGGYSGDNMPTQNWAWPQETWFQKRLDQLRKKRRQTVGQPQRLQTHIFAQGKPFESCAQRFGMSLSLISDAVGGRKRFR
jgi:hypothetical protein